jgi:hypothetical protein
MSTPTKADILRTKAALLTREEREHSAVEGDRLMLGGDPLGESLVLEAVLGLRVQKAPHKSGYHPMMARMLLLAHS